MEIRGQDVHGAGLALGHLLQNPRLGNGYDPARQVIAIPGKLIDRNPVNQPAHAIGKLFQGHFNRSFVT